jgi:uncharacterized protein YdaU (DUF1376 family)
MDWTKHPPQPPGLALLERGVLIALEEIYLAHGRLPSSKDQILRACGAHSRQEVAVVEAVLNQFFVLDRGSWVRGEWDELVFQTAEIRAKRSAAANARWAQSSASGMSKSNANAYASAGANAMQPEMQRRGEEKDKKEKISSSLKEEEGKEGLRGLLEQSICTTGWNEEDEARAGRLIEHFGLQVVLGKAAGIEKETGRRPFLSRVESGLMGGNEDSRGGFVGKDYMMGGGYVQDL